MAQDTSAAPERDADTRINNASYVIVVGLDGSPTSWDAFAWAAGAAVRGNGQLVVVHVLPLMEPAAKRGDVTKAVTKVACAQHADLVVVGRSAKILHRFAGSLGHRLTCRTDAPVVVVVP